jgi:hypothetical protein
MIFSPLDGYPMPPMPPVDHVSSSASQGVGTADERKEEEEEYVLEDDHPCRFF